MKSTQQKHSIMVVSDRDEFSQIISEAFQADDYGAITQKNESFKMMNGHAVELAFDHDVVIFETDPDDQSEVHAIEQLLSQRTGHTVFLAVTDNDVSIAKARQLRKIGINDVLPLSIDSEGLRAVVDEQLAAVQVPERQFHDNQSALGQIFMITQARGGAGATTVAVNMAASLAGGSNSLFRKAQKNSVVLLDFDIQFGNSNVFLDLEDNGGFLQIIDSNEDADDRFVASALQSHKLGFDVLCAPLPVIPLQSMRPELIENLLNILQERYDFILVDLPRALVDWVEPVIKRASRLVLVTDTSVPCVRQARRLIDLYREENVRLPVEVVVNRDKQPLIKSEHVREAEKVLETKFRHWLPDNPKVARNAVDLGRPVVDMKPRSDLGKAMTKLSSALSADIQNNKTKLVQGR